MLRHTSDIADELLDDRPAFPTNQAELKSIIVRGMALEREACARDVEEMSADVAATVNQYSSRSEKYVSQRRAAAVIRARKATG